MRAFIGLCATVFVAVGIGIASLAAAGADSTGSRNVASASAVEQVLNADIASLAQTPSVRISVDHLATSGSSAPVSAVLSLSTDSSASIAQAGRDLNASLSVDARGERLLEARLIAPRRVFVRVEPGALEHLGLGPGQQSIPNLFPPGLAGRWLELPAGVFSRLGVLPRRLALGLRLQHLVAALSTSASTRAILKSGANETVQLSGANRDLAQALGPWLSTGAITRVPLARTGSFSLSATSTSGLLQSVSFSDAAGTDVKLSITHPTLDITAPSGVQPGLSVPGLPAS